eukprot:gene52325-17013_t
MSHSSVDPSMSVKQITTPLLPGAAPATSSLDRL